MKVKRTYNVVIPEATLDFLIERDFSSVDLVDAITQMHDAGEHEPLNLYKDTKDGKEVYRWDTSDWPNDGKLLHTCEDWDCEAGPIEIE